MRAAPEMRPPWYRSKPAMSVLLVAVFLLLCAVIDPGESNPLWRLPPLLKALPYAINDAVQYMLFEWMPIPVYDPIMDLYEQKPLLREVTRGVSDGLLFVINLVREVLLGGVNTIVAFTGWDFINDHEWVYWPALPWTVVAGWAALIGYRLDGLRLAALGAATTCFIAIFGQWEPSMQTLSFVLITAPVAALQGLGLGIWCYRSSVVEAAMNPLLNVAQTMPHYSYLVPVIVLFGVGDHAAAVATIVFATPPMVRLTLLGLKGVPNDVVEAGLMTGCSNRQLTFKVLIPAAKRDVLLGVNQVVMQCLAMTVIASFVGAKGLGSNLMIALNSLKIGTGIEIGICIVLMAVFLDKVSIAWANRKTDYFADRTFLQRHTALLLGAGILVAGALLAMLGSVIFREDFNYLHQIPHNKGLTTETFWQGLVDWIWNAFFEPLNSFNKFLISSVLVPMRDAYLAMPVAATFLLVGGMAYILAGLRSAVIVLLYLLFIAFSEYWDRALITAYMASFAVIVSAVLGVTVGTLCAQNAHASRTALLLCDFFQTFPSFIYLIPVILLFGITDTSVIIAAIAYATVPATRYTIEGLLSIPEVLQDAGSMAGVSRFQRLVSIEFPVAFPHIMLGLNQTVIFALFMVIIGAFIGTTDLGQLILKAISDPQGTGVGLVLGVCVAFIGLAADQVIRTWANNKKRMLGLA
ncbi:MAG: ABC transporter permease subunit [Roseovarius sp.]|uniref:ABC transporter permease n=1 Tax=Roseovarius sp. TaxID=1486281 RepID=UPI0032EE725B